MMIRSVSPVYLSNGAKPLSALVFCLCAAFSLCARQKDSTATITARTPLTTKDSLDRKKLHRFIAGAGAAYGLSLVALDRLWYKDFPRGSFRFFNDNGEWKQVDKVGHFYTAFHLSHAGAKAFRWAGLEQQKAHFWGSMVGMGVLLPIEVFDGFSTEYGASVGDLVANTGGASLFLGQQLLWKEIRIHPKFSFRQSRYSALRPNLLGGNFSEALLKDYNGQTYWLSFDIYRFLGKERRFPKWLNLALGYGAEGMVYANDAVNSNNGFTAYRQYYLSLDIDLTHFRHRSNFLKGLFYVINLVHLPAPALSYDRQDGVMFHWLKF